MDQDLIGKICLLVHKALQRVPDIGDLIVCDTADTDHNAGAFALCFKTRFPSFIFHILFFFVHHHDPVFSLSSQLCDNSLTFLLLIPFILHDCQ